ncbi:hypothetical protein [Ruminococcus sp.]
MNTLKLFLNVQKYCTSLVYAFVICLYGVITFSIYLNSGSDIAYAYEAIMPLILADTIVAAAVGTYIIYANSEKISAANCLSKRNTIGCIFLSVITMSLLISAAYTMWIFAAERSLNSNMFNKLVMKDSVLDLFFKGSALKSYLSAALYFTLVSLASLVISTLIKRFKGIVAVLSVTVFIAAAIKMVSAVNSQTLEDTMTYRRNLALISVMLVIILFSAAYKRMDIKK